MDGELVTDSSSDRSGGEPGGTLPLSYTEQFKEMFPYYLSIGMTPEQYWDGDPSLAKYYREAEELRCEKLNQQLWLQGLYVYDAILCASPILHAFAKKGTKAKPYPEKAYAVTAKQQRKEAEAEEKKVLNKGIRYMEAFLANSKNKAAKAAEGERK